MRLLNENEYPANAVQICLKPLWRTFERGFRTGLAARGLTVRDVIFTADEAQSGVRYKAAADWPVLGKKLKKDMVRVKNALPNVSSDAIKQYQETGELVVDGITLVAGDLSVQRFIELPTGAEAKYATNTDNDVVVRLDIQVHPELVGEWLSRELINRVQKLRKAAGLQATDDIDVFYKFEDGSGADILAAMKEYSEVIQRTVRSVPKDVIKRKEGQKVLIEEEQEIAEVKFVLSLAHL